MALYGFMCFHSVHLPKERGLSVGFRWPICTHLRFQDRMLIRKVTSASWVSLRYVASSRGRPASDLH